MVKYTWQFLALFKQDLGQTLLMAHGGLCPWPKVVRFYMSLTYLSQSSTLTTGPKVLAGKTWVGLVNIGNLEVGRAYKHLTVTCYTSYPQQSQLFNQFSVTL